MTYRAGAHYIALHKSLRGSLSFSQHRIIFCSHYYSSYAKMQQAWSAPSALAWTADTPPVMGYGTYLALRDSINSRIEVPPPPRDSAETCLILSPSKSTFLHSKADQHIGEEEALVRNWAWDPSLDWRLRIAHIEEDPAWYLKTFSQAEGGTSYERFNLRDLVDVHYSKVSKLDRCRIEMIRGNPVEDTGVRKRMKAQIVRSLFLHGVQFHTGVEIARRCESIWYSHDPQPLLAALVAPTSDDIYILQEKQREQYEASRREFESQPNRPVTRSSTARQRQDELVARLGGVPSMRGGERPSAMTPTPLPGAGQLHELLQRARAVLRQARLAARRGRVGIPADRGTAERISRVVRDINVVLWRVRQYDRDMQLHGVMGLRPATGPPIELVLRYLTYLKTELRAAASNIPELMTDAAFAAEVEIHRVRQASQEVGITSVVQEQDIMVAEEDELQPHRQESQGSSTSTNSSLGTEWVERALQDQERRDMELQSLQPRLVGLRNARSTIAARRTQLGSSPRGSPIRRRASGSPIAPPTTSPGTSRWELFNRRLMADAHRLADTNHILLRGRGERSPRSPLSDV